MMKKKITKSPYPKRRTKRTKKMEDDVVNSINKNLEEEEKKVTLSTKKLAALKGARAAKTVKKDYMETFNTTYLDHLDNIHANLKVLSTQIGTITHYLTEKPELPEVEKPQPPIEKSLLPFDSDLSYRLGQALAVGGSAMALYYRFNG